MTLLSTVNSKKNAKKLILKKERTIICTLQPANSWVIYQSILKFKSLITQSQVPFSTSYTLAVVSLLTIFTSDHNQARGVGWRADNANGIPGNHSELIPLICCQTRNSVLAVMHVGQVGFEPAAMSLAFLNVVASNLATSVTFGGIPFQTY